MPDDRAINGRQAWRIRTIPSVRGVRGCRLVLLGLEAGAARDAIAGLCAVLAGVLTLCVGALLAPAAQASSSYLIEQRQGDNESVITLAQSGLRYETLAPQRGGGRTRGKRAKPVLGVIIRYSDGAVFLLDLEHRQYEALALQSTITRYEGELKALARAQPSVKLPPRPGVKAPAGQVSLKAPKAKLLALALTTRIGPLTARAYLLSQGRLRERLWYAAGLPGPPPHIRKLLTQALAGSSAGLLGSALRAHAAQIPLRIDELRGRHWRTVLRTVRVRRSTLTARTLQVPHGYARHVPAPARASGQAHVASVPADPLRCGVAVVTGAGCTSGVTDGPVSEHPAIWAFYWGPHFAEHRDFVSSVNKGLEDMVGDQFAGPGSKSFWGPLSQYGVGQGRLLGYEIITDKPASSVGTWNFFDVEYFTFIHRFGSDAPNYWWRDSDESPIFAVFVDESEVGSSGWAGYHFFTPSEGILFSFLVHPAIPWLIVKVPKLASVTHERESDAYLSSLNTTTARASHEFAEAATDPYPFISWADPFKEPVWEHGEIGDICEEDSYPWGRRTRTEQRGTVVSPFWSNADNACIPEARPTAHIAFPAHAETHSWGSDVTFIVQAEDVYDGTVPEQDIAWNDDKDGLAIGHGRIFTTSTLSPGVHHIYAYVTDSQGGVRGTDPVTINVVVQPPDVKISEPSSGAEYGSDQFINFRGSAFDPAQGDLAASATWSVDGVPVGTGATLFKYRIPTEGTHTVTLAATDSAHASSSASITVKIGPAVGKPTVQITSPANGTSFAAGEAIKFTAAAEALGGATVPESGYVWTDDLDGPLGTGQTLTHTLSGSTCVIFEHHVTVTVTDSFSRTATDTIVVNDGGIC